MKPFLAQGGDQTLDAIYLDTASVWSMVKPPSKVGFCSYTSRLASDLTGPFFLPQRAATEGLVDLMGRFPVTTCFFVNAWTWGYEDILIAIADHFGDKVGLPFDIMPLLSIEFSDTR
jgi:hypothetical protein